MPEISVLLPVRDGKNTLAESVASILNQEDVDLELIVVNDGSKDGTASILEAFSDPRVKVLTNPASLGITTCLNLALAAAAAPYVARIDADDIAHPFRLRRQLNALISSQADIAFCRCNYIDERTGGKWEWREAPPGLGDWRNLFGNGYGPHPSSFMRRDCVRQLGGYDPSFHRSQDYDLWDRASEAGAKFLFLEETLMTCRVLESSITVAATAEQQEAAMRVSRRAMRRYLPDITSDAAQALIWLNSRMSAEPSLQAMTAGLSCLPSLLAEFLRSCPTAEPGLVLGDAASNLARRLPRIAPKLRQRAFSLAWTYSLKRGDYKALLRLARRYSLSWI